MALRIDRIVSVYVFRTLTKARTRHAVPILMYHSISDGDGGAMRPYYETRTSLDRFAEHVNWLHDNGYRTLGLESLSEGTAPEKNVVITFDDGFLDFYTNAAPLLAEKGFTATMFLPTAYVGDDRRRFKDKPCMTWNEVRELQRAGFTFGSHTVTHPELHTLDSTQIEYEVRTSKQTLEDQTGTSAEFFAYPYAFPEADRAFAERLHGTLQDSGYRAAVSTSIGTAVAGNGDFFLKRLPVNDWDDLALFQAKMEGAYDWMHTAQLLKKHWNRAHL